VLEIDDVIFTGEDLDAAAGRLLGDYGLASVRRAANSPKA
jgi:hypothetical protein